MKGNEILKFLACFGSFGQAVSEEKNLKKSANQKQVSPCLLMDRDKMGKLYRGPPIDASYQVSVHLDKWFQRRRI
jgi:hypothetical protein